jgi:hypothetical protein
VRDHASRRLVKPAAASGGATSTSGGSERDAAAAALLAVADDGAAEQDAAEALTPWRPPPISAYQLFPRSEADRSVHVQAVTEPLGPDDWVAIGKAWSQLSVEDREPYERQLLPNVEACNKRVATSCCAYLCEFGVHDLMSSSVCGADERSGHSVCYMVQL